MIHLDRNHSSPHATSNLILDNIPPSDQHSLLSWSGPPRDDRPFYQDSEVPDIPSIHPDIAAKDAPSSPRSSPSLRTDAPYTSTHAPSESLVDIPLEDAPESKEEDPTLSSPGLANITSPTLGSSSSLTPPPDANSPASPSRPESLDPSAPPNSGSEGVTEGETDDVEKASRASTPLSELSSALDADEQPSSTANAEVARGSASDDSKGVADGKSSSTDGTLTRSKPPFPADNQAPTKPVQTSAGSGFGQNGHVVDSLHQLGNVMSSVQAVVDTPAKPNAKVVTILELNTHLLRVFMELQAQKVPVVDARCQEYSTRLQTNLTWLAAAADEGQRVSLSQIALPNMQSPPSVPSASMERIQHIYAELPTLFQKDIARREQQNNSSLLKRDRPDETFPNMTSKRRDTGDGKSMSFSPSPSQSTTFTQFPVQSTGVPEAGASSNSSAGPSMQLQSPAGGHHTGLQDPRQLHSRLGQHPHLEPRQASPPGASPSAGHPQMQMSQAQATSVLQQQYQILQNPSHPMVQYLNQTIPNFSTLPVPQQLQKMQTVQAMMRQQSQQRAGSQSKGNPASNGFGQPMSTTGLPNSPVNGGSSRVSPTSHAFPHSNQGPGQGFDSRATMASLTAQQQAALATMNPQQRQLMLMQQHLMRNAGNTSQNAMLNAQGLSGAQDRMSRAPMAGPSLHPDQNGYSPIRAQTMIQGMSRNGTPSDNFMPSSLQRPQLPMADEFQGTMAGQQGMSSHSQGLNQFAGSSSSPGPSWSPPLAQSGTYGMGMSPPETPFGGQPMSGSSWNTGSMNMPDRMPTLPQNTGAISLQQGIPLGDDASNDLDSMFDWGQ
ncbi:hypothetical protein BXZ70DRAFT_744128 [Cristinia sonorae]|uniref:Uncharacterized protein n=1 Tax=Cristinia sonorae TaxID=1940300 RepID=A0A8K0UCQ5_9AGAR|nr:hypothetical protein BXZ70DRAFT_744128 [Cristinia sonorae]